VVTLKLDPSGHELKRLRRLEGATAKQFTDLADAILSVHARFPSDAHRWESSAKLITAQGQTVAGTLAFEKVAFAPGAVRVKVSGHLAPVGQAPKVEEVRTPSYTVTGEQVYDLTAQEWRSARWSIDVAFDVTRAGKPSGTASGMIKLAMNAVKGTQSERASTEAERDRAPKRKAAVAKGKAKDDPKAKAGNPAAKAKDPGTQVQKAPASARRDP
jgi:hypothetical protein